MPKFRDPLPVGKLETDEEKHNVERNFREIVNDTIRHMDKTGGQFPQERAVHGRVTLKEDGGVTKAIIDLEGDAIFSGRDSYNVKVTVEMEPDEGLRDARTVAVRRLSGKQFEIISQDNAGINIGFTAYGN